MKNILKILIYFFMGIGVTLALMAIIGILQDRVIHFNGTIDWTYFKKIAEICAFLAVPWNIVGVFLLYLTFNVQQDQFKTTDNYIRQQQFETTFFNMLNVLTNIKKSIYFESNASDCGNPTPNIRVKRDQEFFDYALKKLKVSYEEYYTDQGKDNPVRKILAKVNQNFPITNLERDVVRDDLNLVYLDFYKEFHSNLGHYFRYVYNLVKFAIKVRSKDKDEKNYIDLIQAQLTNDELSLIFYNACSDNGLNNQKEYQFYKWLDEYNFFENLDDRSLLLREHHILYPKTKFKFLNSDETLLKS